MNANILIGIGGGSGSGKSSVAKNILREFGEGEVTIIEQDSYYHDLSHLPFNERLKTNFDHPDAIDFDLLRSHLKSLLKGDTISIPIYDFSTHIRSPDTREIKPHHAIVLEGIMVFTDKILREMINIKIYVATDPDIRIIRRLTRDIRERGRTFEDVVRQYLDIVRPMHEQFVETTKKFAETVCGMMANELVNA